MQHQVAVPRQDDVKLAQHGIPLYHQLKEIFIEKIVNHEWRPGENIPPEGQLCAQYAISRGPVRQALDELVREGLLARKQGKGTWVLPPKIERGLGGFYSFTTLIEQRGLRHSTRLLSMDTAPATRGVARSLGLAQEELVVRISRLRMADDEPLILETIYVPDSLCPGLSQEDVLSVPLYTLLLRRYGVPLVRAKQFFEPVVADEYEAGILQVLKGAPALLLQNVTYSSGDLPIVLSKAIIRGDRVRYYVELSGPIEGA